MLFRSEFTALGDRKNIILSSTSVTGGKATAIVTGTGMNTEVGHIANMLLDDETPQTPLQLKLADTGKTLGIAALFVCLVIFIVGLFRQVYEAALNKIRDQATKERLLYGNWDFVEANDMAIYNKIGRAHV